MAELQRVEVTWSGSTVVGGGVSVFYFLIPATGFVAALADYFTAVKDNHPPGTQWTIPNSGDIIQDTDGTLVDSWSDGTTTVVTAAGSVTYANGVGLRVVWNTNGFFGGRRVRGWTFHVPLTVDK